MLYITELITFPVKQGKKARAEEWMHTLLARQAECVATLDREAMHFETIFRSQSNGRTYLSWFSVQEPSGESVHTSPLPIDTVHMEFWRECIDASVTPTKYEHIVNFIPAALAEAIAQRERTLSQNAT